MTSHALEGWQEEKRSVYMYHAVAEVEAGTPRQALFKELAAAAEGQSKLWEAELRKQGEPVPAAFHPELRARLVVWLMRRLGPRAMRHVLAAMKVRGMSLYFKADHGHSMPTNVADIGKRHQGHNGNGSLRAAVFGVNDGLVSNASLILGVAGAAASSHTLLLTGVAGLLAGAFSMAAGEYISMRSQREMFEHQIGLEREELEQYPQEEAAELALIYAAKGIPLAEAKKLADTLIADPVRALDTLAREELGLNPDELGSPWGAALSSFVSFALGAAVPLAPFLFGSGTPALSWSVGLTAAALFGVGATLSLFTGRYALFGGLRMLLIGSAAGGATYLIGQWVGVSLG
jgi:VIT1/CCC1 family predicted Fe2+/Mn2+ transporter